MKKFLFIGMLAASGCLSTSTKTDLGRPDFSKSRKPEIADDEPACLTSKEKLILDQKMLEILDKIQKENEAAKVRITAEIAALSSSSTK